jgi:hypothetical protein
MPPPKVAKALAQILSVLLLIFGAYSFVPNPLVGETGIFAVNAAHAGVFIVLAVLLFAFHQEGRVDGRGGSLWSRRDICFSGDRRPPGAERAALRRER